jgi:signal transduction histidine kinase
MVVRSRPDWLTLKIHEIMPIGDRMRPRPISELSARPPDHPRVLIGCPEGSWSRALIGALRSEGFLVEHVTDAVALVESLAREPAHLLVLGRDFSGFPGFDLCRTLKADPASFLPIIAVAPEDASPESERLAWKAGVDHFFGRGCDLGNLTLRARSLVGATATFRAGIQRVHELGTRFDWVRYLVHDLRSPVGAAQGAVRFLQKALANSTDPDVRGALDDADSALRSIIAMVQDIIDTDRLRRGALLPERKPIDLSAIAREVSKSSLAEARPRGLDIVTIAPRAPVAGDPTLLTRAVTNLVQNAVRHARRRPVIVEVEPGAPVTFRVTNDGPGIAPEHVQSLFEPWVVLDGAAKGTGLGLAFCRNVILAHGGRIWLDSADEGCVSFAFSLPGGESQAA